MQGYRGHLSPEDRRIAWRWTLASLSLYGMLAGMILYVTFTAKPNEELAASLPTAKANVAGVEREDKRPGSVSRRGCDKALC